MWCGEEIRPLHTNVGTISLSSWLLASWVTEKPTEFSTHDAPDAVRGIVPELATLGIAVGHTQQRVVTERVGGHTVTHYTFVHLTRTFGCWEKEATRNAKYIVGTLCY